MRNESDRLRKAMLSELVKAKVSAVLYVAHHRVRREGRAEILRHVVANERINRLVLESRGVQDREDTQVLYDAVRKEGLDRRPAPRLGRCKKPPVGPSSLFFDFHAALERRDGEHDLLEALHTERPAHPTPE